MIGDAANFSSAGRTHWGWIITVTLLLVFLPAGFDTHTPTLLGIWALFALSLGLMWGYAGILSFGHAAYFGLGAYTYAITAMDSIIRSEDDATKATWRLDQIPVLKRFMISDLGAGTVNDYYDLKDKVDEVVRTSNQLERTGDIKNLTEYLKENGQVLAIKDYVRDLDKDMKSIRESKMAINMSRMDPDQKREALDALRRAEIALTERIGTLRKSMGI